MVRYILGEWKKENSLKKAADILGLFMVVLGIGVSIFMNCVGRSFWVDEAMLAYSFSERPLWKLTAAPFEWLQSAPVLYLYFAKVISLVFGNSEFVLRSVSVFSYIVTLGLVWYAAKRLFQIRYALLCSAFLANMNFMLLYSNMFKQYMWECIWALLVLVAYYLYKEEKLSFWRLSILYMVFLWGANPACFMIGGVLAWEFIAGVWTKDKTVVRRSILTGVGVLASFAVYYLYWLRGVAGSEEMQRYWEGAVFPLVPRSIADLKEAQALAYDIFIVFREGRMFVMGLVLAALVFGIFRERNRYVIVTALGFFLCLFASWLNMFPVADRMWCFAYPLFAMLVFMAADRMFCTAAVTETGGGSGRRPVTSGEVAAVMLMFVLILTSNGILVYRHGETVYMAGEEVNFPIAYVQERIEPGESVYVYHHSIPAVKYKIGYDTDCFGAAGEDNVIWSAGTANDSEALESDAARIEAAGRCYLIASHTTEERFSPLLQELSMRGSLEVLQNQYDTPLYYFAKEEADSKLAVEYELISQEEEGDTCYVTIRVKNTGDSFINTTFDDVTLGCRDREEIGTNLWRNLEPGAYYDMPLQFDWQGSTAVSLQLRNGEKYWYDDLGFPAITITKGE